MYNGGYQIKLIKGFKKMSTASISRAQAQQLSDFCVKHSIDEIAFVVDHGAYFMARKGTPENDDFENSIQYLKGLNPNTADSDDWYDEQRYKFGGDDFFVKLPSSWLLVILKNVKKQSFSIKLNANSIKLNQ